ncbi:hypothetical protein HZC21_02195 [Candidatus Peregrinibacteria bacterium]|nr:hypothetical protein [Candidatus Peregrinibacteria bacterium]
MEMLPNVYLDGEVPHNYRQTFRKEDILKHTTGDKRMVPACVLADMHLVAVMAGEFSEEIRRTAANVWKRRCSHDRAGRTPETQSEPWVTDGDNLMNQLLAEIKVPYQPKI